MPRVGIAVVASRVHVAIGLKGGWAGAFCVPARTFAVGVGTQRYGLRRPMLGASGNALWRYRGKRAEEALRQPWEVGDMSIVFGSGSGLAALEPPKRLEAALLPDEDTERVGEVPADAGVLAACTKDAGRWQAPPKHEDQERRTRLAQWRTIVLTMGASCGMYDQLAGANQEEQEQLVINTFAGKATATLARRASSMSLYMRWCHKELGSPGEGFPVSEAGVYMYVEYLRAMGAPATRAQSFVEAVYFAKGTVRLEIDEALDDSARVRGAIARCWESKRLTKKAKPFSVAHVKKLEELVVYGDDLQTRVEAGFVCFMIYSRSRCKDASRINREPVLDLCGGKGFVETTADRVKTTKGLKRARLGLPVVALARGVLGDEVWAKAWLDARKEAGYHAEGSQVLMPAEAANGAKAWDIGMSAPQLSLLIRRLLNLAGADLGGVEYSSHSCKATVLSWLAKAGASMGTRRLLGGHIKVGEKTPLEYSRDALAGPLREAENLVAKINGGEFNPDATRSGRWTTGDAEGNFELVPSEGAASQASGSESDEPIGSSSSSVGDPGDEVEDERAAELEGQQALEEVAAAPEDDVPPGMDAFYHPRTFVRHLSRIGGESRLLCGRELPRGAVAGGGVGQPLCKQCMRVVER